VSLRRRTRVTGALIETEAPEVVVVATGGKPRRPVLPGMDTAHVVDTWQVLKRRMSGRAW